MTTSQTLEVVQSVAVLEQAALEEYGTVIASMRHEVVGLGLKFSPDTMAVWYRLHNISPRFGSFLVAGEEVKAVMEEAQRLNGPVAQVRLWHSHYVRDVPSRADLENFPQWAERGLLFHTPSERTLAYTKAGLLSA